MKRPQRDTLSRRAMKLLCRLTGLVLAVMLTGTLAVEAVLAPVNQVEPGAEAAVSTLSVLSPVNLGLSPTGTRQDTIGGPGSGILNILLVGHDRREGEDASRSDSMILCTFNKQTKQLILTSFLRDLYVEIPGYHANRINAAYAYGGIGLLRQTLSHNFGLHIDGTVEVDFSQFAGIIDLLGGVEIELRADEAREINQVIGSSLSGGLQRLTGQQALTYSRIRKLDGDGDFSRTGRQRRVLSALMNRYRSITLKELVPLAARLLPLITTDMNNGQILIFAMEVLPYLSQAELVSQHVPAEGTFSYRRIDEMSVIQADPAAVRKLLKDTLMKTD